MTNKELEQWNELNKAFSKRMKSEENKSEGDNITLYDLYNLLYSKLSKYTDFFKKSSLLISRKKNIKSFCERFLGNVPKISSICPGVDEEGNKYIRVFLNDGGYVGEAIINSDYQVDYKGLYYAFNKDDVTKLILSDPNEYFPIFCILEDFASKHEGVACEWNNSYSPMVEVFEDELFQVHFDIEDKDLPSVAFIHEYTDISRFEHETAGCLYEYVSTQAEKILKRMSVNVNDLSKLYKSLIKDEYNLENGPVQERVK